MTDITKMSIKVQTVISIVMVAVTWTASYYGNKRAIEDVINEIRTEAAKSNAEIALRFKDLENRNDLQDRDIFDINRNEERLEKAVMSYLSKTPQVR